MRRLLAVVLAVGLVASLSAVSLAAPSVSGLIVTRYEANLSDNPVLKDTHTRLRLNVSGQAGENLSYYGRFQGFSGQPWSNSGNVSVALAYATYSLPSGVKLQVGRQPVVWSILDELSGMYKYTGAANPGTDAVLLSVPAGPATVQAVYGFDDSVAGAYVQVPVTQTGPRVAVGAQVLAQAGNDLGWGVNGSVGLGVATAYVEVGKGIVNDAGAPTGVPRLPNKEYQVVGLRFDVLKQVAGVEALVEYDVKSEALFYRVGREILPGLSVHLRGGYDQGNGITGGAAGTKPGELGLRVELSVPF